MQDRLVASLTAHQCAYFFVFIRSLALAAIGSAHLGHSCESATADCFYKNVKSLMDDGHDLQKMANGQKSGKTIPLLILGIDWIILIVGWYGKTKHQYNSSH